MVGTRVKSGDAVLAPSQSAYALLDAALTFRATGSLELTLSGRNLTDNHFISNP